MGKKLLIRNPNLNKEEKSYITSDYSTGTNVVVRNSEGFTTGWFLVVGEPGTEQTESAEISSIADNTTIVLTGSLNFSHAKSTPVYLSRWDRLYMYRSSTEDGTYSAVTNAETSNVYWDIEWDNGDLETMVIDDAGNSTDYYKWRFYNSSTGTYSGYSGVLPASGLDKTKAGYVIKQVERVQAAKGVPHEIMYEYMSDYSGLVYEKLPKAWWFMKEGTQVSTDDSTYKFNISDNWSDLNSINYVMYRYISGSVDNTYPLKYMTLLEFYNTKSDANKAADDSAVHWTMQPADASSSKGYISIDPAPKTENCYLYPVYFFELTDIDSFDDTLVVPHSKGYVDYVLYRIFDDIKSDTTNADKYAVRVSSSLESLKERTRRQKGQREWIRYRGPQGWSKNFGGPGGNSSTRREQYW